MQNYFIQKKEGITEDIVHELLGDSLAILETMPEPEFFFEIPLGCEDDIFFEGLVMAVKTNTLSLQQNLSNCKNNYIN
jgi:hypothetical protein